MKNTEAIDKGTNNKVHNGARIADANTLLGDGLVLVTKKFTSDDEINNFVEYVNGKFVRFLLAMGKRGMNTSGVSWRFVPDMIDYSVGWNDEKLYEYFELTREEIDAIEVFVKSCD